MQCPCGCFYSYRAITNPEKEEALLDLCPACIKASTPQSYTYSKEYVCDNDTVIRTD